MQGGGHIRGWRVDGAQNAQIEEAARALEKEGLAFAVGDGNHSLAAARRCWELSGEPLARWALVEIVNVYDEALVFEPIHRAIFGGDAASLRAALRAGGRAYLDSVPHEFWRMQSFDGLSLVAEYIPAAVPTPRTSSSGTPAPRMSSRA